MGMCGVIDCSTRSSRDKVSFFSLPKVLEHQGADSRQLSLLRRITWLDNICREDIKNHNHVEVCSNHFLSGRPAQLYNTKDPDWAPTLNMGHDNIKVSGLITTRRTMCEEASQETEAIRDVSTDMSLKANEETCVVIMGACSVVDCSAVKMPFFPLPTVIEHQGEESRRLSLLRRISWLGNICREDIKTFNNVQVCSNHYLSGQPAELCETEDPDWAPTLNMGHNNIKVAGVIITGHTMAGKFIQEPKAIGGVSGDSAGGSPVTSSKPRKNYNSKRLRQNDTVTDAMAYGIGTNSYVPADKRGGKLLTQHVLGSIYPTTWLLNHHNDSVMEICGQQKKQDRDSLFASVLPISKNVEGSVSKKQKNIVTKQLLKKSRQLGNRVGKAEQIAEQAWYTPMGNCEDKSSGQGEGPVTSAPEKQPLMEKVYINTPHSNQMMEKLSQLWHKEQFCDAVISNGTATIKAHKVVLLAACPVLMSLNANISTHSVLNVKLPSDIDRDTIHALLVYIYDGVLRLTADTLPQMKRLTNILKEDLVHTYCEDFESRVAENGPTPETFLDQENGTMVSLMSSDKDVDVQEKLSDRSDSTKRFAPAITVTVATQTTRTIRTRKRKAPSLSQNEITVLTTLTAPSWPMPESAKPSPESAAPTPESAAPKPKSAEGTPLSAAPTPESAAPTPSQSTLTTCDDPAAAVSKMVTTDQSTGTDTTSSTLEQSTDPPVDLSAVKADMKMTGEESSLPVQANTLYQNISTGELTYFNPVAKKKGDKQYQYQCDQCSAKLVSEQHVIIHMDRFHQVGREHAMTNVSKYQPVVTAKEKTYKCRFCDNVQHWRRPLVYHEYFKHQVPLPEGYELYQCDICGRELTKPSTLEQHMNTHKDHASYVCDFCGMGFAKLATMRSHVYHCHNDERKFMCKQCGKSFKCRAQIKIHLRSHTGVRPYKCPKCSYDSTTKGNLNAHMRKRHKLSVNQANIPADEVVGQLDRGPMQELIEVLPGNTSQPADEKE